jgi:hypothetical protein
MTKLCDECETVAHCLKHGCIPKQTALDKKAENARELGLDYEPVGQYSDIVSDGGLDPRNKFDATPPTAQRQWVGLTDEEKRQIFERKEDYQGWLDYINTIEAKLKERNV